MTKRTQATTDWARRQRESAWAYGRGLRNDLLLPFKQKYNLNELPPPAKVVDELLTDTLGAKLTYEPLGPDRFAEARCVDGQIIVTVNTQIAAIEGVKDAEGVENVAKWHEAIHVVRDREFLDLGPQAAFEGFEMPRIVCYRSAHLATPRPAAEREREVWAEEAGRAAAVSIPALSRSIAFLDFASGPRSNSDSWRLLNQAAKDIGVNITALVKQLQLEGLIVVAKESGRQVLYVQPSLIVRTKEGEGEV